MKKIKTFLFVCLMALFVCSLSGCGEENAANDPDDMANKSDEMAWDSSDMARESLSSTEGNQKVPLMHIA